MFEKIHPFDDGNGRTGRFIINVILVNAGYAPLIIRKTQRMAYLKALSDFDGVTQKTLSVSCLKSTRTLSRISFRFT
jgi:Fic family protein